MGLRNLIKRLDIVLSILFIPFALLFYFARTLCTSTSQQSLVVRPGGMGDLILLTLALELYDPNFRENYFFIIETRSEPWARFLNLKYSVYTDYRNFWKLPRFKKTYNTEQRYGLAALYSAIFTDRVFSGKTLFQFESNRFGFWGKSVPYDACTTPETSSFAKLIFDKNLGDFNTLRTAPSNSQFVFFLGGTFSLGRNLDAQEWADIIQAWNADKPLIAISAPEEKAKLKEIVSLCKRKITIQEFPNFNEVAVFLRGCEKVLTVDSGALHLCSYFGVSTDSVFTNGRFLKWKPLAGRSRVLKTELPCQSCVLFGHEPPCKINYQCNHLKGIQWKPVS